MWPLMVFQRKEREFIYSITMTVCENPNSQADNRKDLEALQGVSFEWMDAIND